ncbi:MAG: hypothetical protein JO100_02610 [Pseudonocardia sp.]|nr:hypothetical protein [Pseudonocardia sp.]
MSKVSWRAEPDAHDYPAAASYLSLLSRPEVVDEIVARLQAASKSSFKAKDILRASGLPLLPVDNPHVANDLKKVKNNQDLSPILLVRGDLTRGLALQVADGYHRVCASYHTDENTDLPCRIADNPELERYAIELDARAHGRAD